MVKFGLPYQGSKSAIAEWVVSALPASHTLVDLFAGGCAVSHAAIASGKWDTVVANDISDAPAAFAKALKAAGEVPQVPTRQEFEQGGDELARLLYSFGNNGRSYLWGIDEEKVKVAASRMLMAPTLPERRTAYKAFCRELAAYLDGRDPVTALGGSDGYQGLARLQAVEAAERVIGFSGKGAGALEVSNLDYRDVEIPDGATVYADPPYRNAVDPRDYGGQFDWLAFDGWLAGTTFPVIVSEYDAPAGCVEIDRRAKTVGMNSQTNKRRVEKLFVQERYADLFTPQLMGRLF